MNFSHRLKLRAEIALNWEIDFQYLQTDPGDILVQRVQLKLTSNSPS